MAPVIGKRKHKAPIRQIADETTQESSESEGAEDIQAIFRRHFEAQFTPLETKPGSKLSVTKQQGPDSAVTVSENDEGENESPWSGISSEESDDAVEVVEHMQGYRLEAGSGKNEIRTYMSSKPPRLKEQQKASSQRSQKAVGSDDEAESDALNLKNDVALQQLLRESHLLDRSADRHLSPTGKNRHKALDLRVQSLGSKGSVFKQERMPMAHRKGIAAKSKSREDKRRHQAKENGIILERAIKTKKGGSEERRDKGIAGHSVGKFKGGTLNLSKWDLRDIQGSKNAQNKRRRR